MIAARLWRSLPGHLAWALATVVGTIAAVTAVYSYFYEGWGLGPIAAAGYLAPPMLVVGLGAPAVRRPRAGGQPAWAGATVLNRSELRGYMRDRDSESTTERARRRPSRTEQAAHEGRNPTSGRRDPGRGA
jgi:hypothetical protein